MVAVPVHNPYRTITKGSQRTASPTPRPRQINKFASRQDEELYDESGQFNPVRGADRPDRAQVRTALRQSRERTFDRSGTLIAENRRDALQQIAHVMDKAANLAPVRRQGSLDTLNDSEKRKVIAAALNDPSGEGFRLVGQELALPIKDILDYEAWGRKRLRVRHLKQGEFFRITRDVRGTAWTIGQDGQTLESVVKGQYVPLNPFKITAFGAVDIDDIWEANYDILDRLEDTIRQEIQREEDKRVVQLMDAAATTFNVPTNFASLGIGVLEDMRRLIERHPLIADCVAIHRDELSDIVKTMSTQVDPVTQREIILAGYAGSLLNMKILVASGLGVNQTIPSGTVYMMAAPEYCGEFAIQIELQAEQYSKLVVQETKKGWGFIEKIAMAWVNSRAIAKGLKV